MSLFKKLFGTKKVQPKIAQESSSDKKPLSFEQAMEVLQKHKRTCYIVETEEAPFSFSAHSKMGGYPYLRDENDWPTCPSCTKNMQLFLQLNLNDLPERKEEDLIQLFYCTSEEPHCESNLEAFFPFSQGAIARRITPSGESATIAPNTTNLFPERHIATWEKRDDYPHFEEYAELGIDLEIDDDVYEIMEDRGVGIPCQEDKLFGWPYWVQSVEYPTDRSTGKQMELLFQISSEHNLPYMFGDMGIGHLTQSPDDFEEFGFGWACS